MLADYYDRVTIGDCLAVMSDIEDNCVDMCFADPPFNLEKKYTSYKDQKPAAAYLEWCKKWLAEMVRAQLTSIEKKRLRASHIEPRPLELEELAFQGALLEEPPDYLAGSEEGS